MATTSPSRPVARSAPVARLVEVLPWAQSREQGARWAVGAVVVGAFVLGWLDGGFDASRWAPAAVAGIWLALAAWALARPRTVRRPIAIALWSYGALLAWTLLSATWADTPGRALDAAGRTALYGAALALVLLPRWPRASVRRLLVLVGVAGTVLAAATLARVAFADQPHRLFIDGRLVAPAGYVNAAAGIWVVVAPVLVGLAAGGVRHPLGRVAALAGAGLALQVGLLSQSRGGLIAVVGAFLVLVLLAPNRGATLLATAAAFGATALAAPEIVHVRGAPSVAALIDRIDGATDRILLALLLLVAAGGLWQLLLVRSGDRRRRLSDPRLGNRATVGLAAAALVAFVVAVGNPVGWGVDRVDEALHGGYAAVAPTGDRLTGSLGTNRGDFYAVALQAWRAQPLRGVGAEDFQPEYLRRRDSGESPRYAHSLPLGILSGIGLVGLALALAAFAPLYVEAARRLRAVARETRALTAIAGAAFAGWGLQAAWDWTWEFPVLTLLAVVLLGVLVRSTDVAGTPPTPELRAIRARARAHGLDVPPERGCAPVVPGTPGRRATAAGLVVAALVASVALAAAGASSYFFRQGTAASATHPEHAQLALARAARLNPWNADATLSRAIVVRRLGDRAEWRRELVRTIERSPQDWLAHLELGLADVARPGGRAAGIASLRRAVALNPRQPVVAEVLRETLAGRTIDPGRAEAALANRHADLLRPVSND